MEANSMDYKELRIADLINGYILDDKREMYSCIFCGKSYELNQIYKFGDNLYNAKGAIRKHIAEDHNGVFNSLIKLDKDISGLTEIQTDILANNFEGLSNKEIAEILGISPATVRSHNFKLQKQKRQAKILLTILALIDRNNAQKKTDEKSLITKLQDAEENSEIDKEELETESEWDMLHPFFTKYNLR